MAIRGSRFRGGSTVGLGCVGWVGDTVGVGGHLKILRFCNPKKWRVFDSDDFFPLKIGRLFSFFFWNLVWFGGDSDFFVDDFFGWIES